MVPRRSPSPRSTELSLDLLVHGGTVVTADGSFAADVGVVDGRIDAVYGHEAGPHRPLAAREIDASGLLVLPGVIDVHTHTRTPTDANPDRFYQDSVAAAYGGTTTFLSFNNPGTGISEGAQRSLAAGIDEWRAATAGESAIDFGLSGVITAQQEAPEADVAAAIEAGVATFKCFLVYDFGVTPERLRTLLSVVHESGGMLEVHGEDADMLDAGIDEELSAGRTQPRYHADSRPPAVEATGIRTAIDIAREVDAPIYFVHVSSDAAVKEIAAARALGQPIFAETCPQYLTLDASAYEAPDELAIRYVISPPLRALSDQDTLWRALDRGLLDLVATDHVPDRLDDEKRWTGQSFEGISNGGPGIETLLSMVYGKGAAEGRITIERMVDLLSTTPAQIFGLPTKGAIEAGKDADLVLLDPSLRRTIQAADLHHTSDFTPYEGIEVPGVIRHVLVRGTNVIRDRTYVGTRGFGRYQVRTLI
jgi:dihydropyrimidinase